MDLLSLEKRKLRCDMIDTFKILNDYDKIDKKCTLPNEHNQINQKSGWKLRGKKFYTDTGKHFFANRVVNYWNSLQINVVLPVRPLLKCLKRA